MILLIDNYDSFTWNLVQSMTGLGAEVRVVRNDALTPAEALGLRPAAVVLSPGPGRPDQAGISGAVLAGLDPGTPLLGVCLGHQVLIQHYGGRIARDPVPTHGRASAVRHRGGALYAELPNPFDAGRYHSLRATEPLPDALELEAWLEPEPDRPGGPDPEPAPNRGTIMGVRHRELPRFGVQFHPESILTPHGDRLVANFLGLAGAMAVELPTGPSRADHGGFRRKRPPGDPSRP